MLYEILVIFVCMFAAFGITELTVYAFNSLCASKLPCKFYMLADNFEKEDAEYVIRFLEGVIARSGLECTVQGIIIGKNTDIDESILEELKKEFGNIIEYP